VNTEPVLSWWTSPELQHSYTLFAAALAIEAHRMRIEAGRVRWPIDRGIVPAKRERVH